MNEESRSKAKELFFAALELASDKRDAFLDTACKGDRTLRARIQDLLEAHDAASDFLVDPYGGEESEGRRIGPYRIRRKIASGGMGTVYEAEQLPLDRMVALKILPAHLRLSADAVLKFRREAEAGARQSHPGIVTVIDVGEHEGTHYIVQELVEGGLTLSDKLEEFSEIPRGYFRHVAELVSNVAEALQHAHESGVIHRDIKPSNILLTADGRPKVTDFGLAKIEDALALSRTGDFSGTPYYMSPEQVMSRNVTIDKRTDIYSLGVTLYELLTLERPFEGGTIHEVLKKIILIEPEDPNKANPKVPRDLSVICMKAMEKSPQRRYQDMKEFSSDLGRFLHGDAILAKPVGMGVRFWKRVKRNPVVSAAVGVAMLAALCLVGYILFYSYPRIRHERDQAKLDRNKALAAEELADQQRRVAVVEKNKAVESRIEEDAARQEAEEQARIAATRYDRIVRLSDELRLSELEEKADSIWPAHPERIPDLVSWIKEAEELVSRSALHRRTLDTLREKALPREEETSPWEFEDQETGWQHDTLHGLVSDLEKFSDTLTSVKERLAFARTVEKKSIDDHRETWNRAAACPRYKGLAIEPRIGLVPLGQDPDSGLWEFGHLQTGKIPERGKDGKLVITGETGLVFVLIPGGDFDMGAALPSDEHPVGSPNVDPQAIPNDGPVRRVDVEPFFISKYEMTQRQWQRFTGENPSQFNPEFLNIEIEHDDLLPVEQVSWDDCVLVLSRLNLRLPCEEEWEYAARAGTSSIWWTGNRKESLKGAANLSDLSCMKFVDHPSWIHEKWDDGFAVTSPVGFFSANAFGLHDVLGNVCEWCEDHCGRDGRTPGEGTLEESRFRVIRGGSANVASYGCRSTALFIADQSTRIYDFGLRPVADLGRGEDSRER